MHFMFYMNCESEFAMGFIQTLFLQHFNKKTTILLWKDKMFFRETSLQLWGRPNKLPRNVRVFK